MTDLASIVALALVLHVGLPGDPAPASPLPRSSIAAVLAHRGELGLSDAEVTALEERDVALQKHLSEIREPHGANERSAPGEGATRLGKRAGDDAQGARAPSDNALPEGAVGANGGQRHRSGRHGARTSADGRPDDPAGRASRLQMQLDNADTEAWLAAEVLLPEEKRARARDVAEKYREALADAREVTKGVP
jgi:hypothetical protein